MKRRLLLAGIPVALVAFLFLTATQRKPLDLRVTGMTNQEQGGVNIYFSVSNRTAREYYFFTYPQALSNGVWFTSVDDRAPFGGVQGVRSHVRSDQIVYTFRNAGTVRLQVTAWPEPKPWPKWLSGFLKQFHRPQYLNRARRELNTPPFELPAR